VAPQVCALIGRFDEAREWLPARAEGASRARALSLLSVACEQFRSIGMPGWIRRADELRRQLG